MKDYRTMSPEELLEFVEQEWPKLEAALAEEELTPDVTQEIEQFSEAHKALVDRKGELIGARSS